jgi:hypothetical protein
MMKNLYSLKEHQQKKLVPKEISEYAGTIAKISTESMQKFNESAQGKSGRKLVVQMEAIHVGRTANYTFYTKEGLTAGLKSWTSPYNKPVLTHHNDYSGEPVGRILKAEYSENTKSGKPGLVFTVEITDPTAIEKVIDGRYSTVSIGATTDKVTCNICGTDRIEEWCDHYPGDTYEGQTAHFIIGTTFGREVSYVNVPADEHAGNTSVQVEEGTSGQASESVNMEIFQIAEGLFANINHPEVNLYESLNDETKSVINSLMTAERSNAKMDPDPENNNPNPTVPVQEGATNPPVVPAAPPAVPPVTPVQEGQQQPPAVPVQEGQQQPPAVPAAPTTPVAEADQSKTITEMQGTITNLVMEKQKLESRLAEQQTEVDRLLQENADLHAKTHRTLAEQVVDLKRSMNKPDVVGVDREESVTNHVSRSKESLENTLQDLLAEKQNLRPAAGSVQNPGYSGEEGQGEPQGQGGNPMSMEEAANIISGMFSVKKRKR